MNVIDLFSGVGGFSIGLKNIGFNIVAFKRRWDWEYVPIDYIDAENQTIQITNKKYSWAIFLEKINEKISEITESEDKQMGNRFVNMADNIITEEVLKNKIMFYLWFDIFKNEDKKDKNYIFKTAEKDYFKYADLFHKENGTKTLLAFFDYHKISEKS